jgi:hypothetical protein
VIRATVAPEVFHRSESKSTHRPSLSSGRFFFGAARLAHSTWIAQALCQVTSKPCLYGVGRSEGTSPPGPASVKTR